MLVFFVSHSTVYLDFMVSVSLSEKVHWGAIINSSLELVTIRKNSPVVRNVLSLM